MIALLLPLFARLGVSEPLQRVLAWLTIIGSALLLMGVLKGCYERSVIDKHEAGISEQVATATNAATDTANANDAKRQTDNARADEQLRGAIADETAKHPEEVRRDAGPATSAALRKLRERQAKAGHTTR